MLASELIDSRSRRAHAFHSNGTEISTAYEQQKQQLERSNSIAGSSYAISGLNAPSDPTHVRLPEYFDERHRPALCKMIASVYEKSNTAQVLPSGIQAIGPLDDITHADRSTFPSSQRESPRLDVDEESTGPRFYGPTSQRHIHDRDVPRDAALSSPSDDADAELNIDSGPVRRLLLDNFWKVQPLSQAIIDQVCRIRSYRPFRVMWTGVFEV